MTDNKKQKIKRATIQGMATLMIAVGANAMMQGMLPRGGAIFAAGCILMVLYEEYGAKHLPDVPEGVYDALRGADLARALEEEKINGEKDETK